MGTVGGDSAELLVEQRAFYRADAVPSDRWLTSLVDGVSIRTSTSTGGAGGSSATCGGRRT